MKRMLLAATLGRLGVTRAVLGLRARTGSAWLTVLTYHRVGPPPSIERLDEQVVAATADGFARQMALCKEHFDVVGVDEVLAFLRGAPLPPRPLLVTFDDGYRDNVDVAFPILRRLGVKAVFFVATSYVDERRLFWWDAVHDVLKRSRREIVELAYPYRLALPLGPEAGHRRDAIVRALRVVKEHYALDLPRFLDHLADAAGVDRDGDAEQALVREHVMTWDDVIALRRGGMDVQSHTHAHRVLHTLPGDALARDLRTSRARLEQALGEPVRAIAYPVGKAPSYPARIRDAVRGAGFELGFSNRSGVNPLARFDPLDAKRMAVEAGFGDDYFAAVLAVPALAYPPRTARVSIA